MWHRLCYARILFELHFSNGFTRKTHIYASRINSAQSSIQTQIHLDSSGVTLILFRIKDSFGFNETNFMELLDFLPSWWHSIDCSPAKHAANWKGNETLSQEILPVHTNQMPLEPINFTSVTPTNGKRVCVFLSSKIYNFNVYEKWRFC